MTGGAERTDGPEEGPQDGADGSAGGPGEAGEPDDPDDPEDLEDSDESGDPGEGAGADGSAGAGEPAEAAGAADAGGADEASGTEADADAETDADAEADADVADADAGGASDSGEAGRSGAAEGSAGAGDKGSDDAAPAETPADAPTDLSAGTAPEEDAGPSGADATPDPAAKRFVKPLVSDIPDRPEGDGDGPVVFGTPGRPVAARTSPYAPMRPAPAPLPPAARPPAREKSSQGSPKAAGAGPAAPVEGERVGPEGTRGMPVPPSPEAPLKLLAELTNTPPKPQTPWRSTLRRFRIWTPLVVLLALVYVIVQAVRPLPSPDLELTAASTYTFDGTPLPQSMPWPSQGQSVAEVEGLGSLGVHGAQTPVPIASVTKVMTAYLILRDHPLTGKQNGPLITVDQQAANESSSTDESTAAVKAGQRFSERQMLQLLLIPSGNNIARLLARWDSGTQEKFVAKMTKAAAGLGMTHTTYTGASGFEETTVSTAEDQLKLARQVMKNDVFRSVVALPNISIPGVGTIYNNNNDLVHLGVVGIKTGSSTPAGGALMWAAQKKVAGKEQLILGVMLQQRGGTTVFDSLQLALDNSQKLINSVQSGLTSATVVKKGEVVGEVHDGLGGSTPVVAGKDLTAIGWPGLTSKVTMTTNSSGVPHNAKAGTQVGTISFGTGTARTTVPVTLRSDLKEPSFGTKLTWI
ncbi:D-alanyl-D-alanine carboxypeptidase [Streptomyces sp. NBC_01476]|uniref:D-alanyl-D-alanine carboxypeptidase n=1 Tax=Streptomyces sp. NBC_01476 TaxID=2903881 RepID=UPI002E343B0D|nr:D-alanyl-D-alanine carboxypeptidase [Streptomyces sp. NBC_01476]